MRFNKKSMLAALKMSAVAVAIGSASLTSYADENSPVVIPSDFYSYIVIMNEVPAIKLENGKKYNSKSAKVQAYQAHLKEMQADSRQQGGIPEIDMTNSYTNVLNGYSALMSYEQARKIAKQAGVKMVLPDTVGFIQSHRHGGHNGHGGRNRSGMATTNYIGSSGRQGMNKKGYTGEGVVIGFVDEGIWPELPSFEDDGSYGPPPEGFNGTKCEFGVSGNPGDAPFECNNKLLAASAHYNSYLATVGSVPGSYPQSARDDNHHGTFVASVAAGNNVHATVSDGVSLGRFSGVAPRARITAYKSLWAGGGFASDTAAAVDQAVEDGVDVISMSLGFGFDSSLSPVELAALYANGAGIAFVASAGNSGPNEETIASPARVPWTLSVAAATHDTVYEGKIKLGNGKTLKGISVSDFSSKMPLLDAGDCLDGGIDSLDVSGKLVVCKNLDVDSDGRIGFIQDLALRGATGLVHVSDESEYEHVSVDDFFTHSKSALNQSIPMINLYPGEEKVLYKYLNRSQHPKAKFLRGAKPVDRKDSQIVFWTSRGPSVYLKKTLNPSLTAPGFNAVSAVPPSFFLDTSDEQYTTIGSGTSLSAPLVAGALAMVKQAHPDWTAAMIQSAVMTTARQNVIAEDGETPATPFMMGNGYLTINGDPKVCAGKVGFRKNICEFKNRFRLKGLKGTVIDPGLVFDAKAFDYYAYTCDDGPLYLPDGDCQYLAGEGFDTTEGSNLNLPSIAIPALLGSKTVTRTVTNVAMSGESSTYKAEVISPTGMTVTVEPSEFTLASGESLTYKVTITSESAIAGEWGFGSVTWQEQGSSNHKWKKREKLYRVYTPIAARSDFIDYPVSVDGSGVADSLSIPVTVGYNGNFATSTYGLVSPSKHVGIISGDPDNTYPEENPIEVSRQLVADGYAFERQVFIPAGTIIARFATFDEFTSNENDDVDLHIFGPNDEIIASSFNNVATEQIELLNPAEGTYSLFVHGYDIPDEAPAITPTTVTLFEWVVGADNNNMTVSAPSSVSIGDIIDVQVNWLGLISPELYLGAITHERDGEVIGVTVIEIDTNE